jgi:hypothetical protein
MRAAFTSQKLSISTLILKRLWGRLATWVGNLRPIGNRPFDSTAVSDCGDDAFVGQPILAAAAFQAASSPRKTSVSVARDVPSRDRLPLV